VRTQARDVATAEAHRASRDGHFTRDRVEERRLARAVGADDRPALAFANAERDAVDGAQRAEADREAVEFDQLQDFLMPWNERLYDACFMYVSGSYFQNCETFGTVSIGTFQNLPSGRRFTVRMYTS
jgi:hypothetical protein